MRAARTHGGGTRPGRGVRLQPGSAHAGAPGRGARGPLEPRWPPEGSARPAALPLWEPERVSFPFLPRQAGEPSKNRASAPRAGL